MIIEKVQANRAAARKDSGRAVEFSILTLLVGEVETIVKRGQEATDEVVSGIIRKLIKANNEVIGLYGEVGSAKFVQENEILKAYLPVSMTEAEIREALMGAVFGNVGEAMKYMTEKFAGKFDKGLASKIAKDLL